MAALNLDRITKQLQAIDEEAAKKKAALTEQLVAAFNAKRDALRVEVANLNEFIKQVGLPYSGFALTKLYAKQDGLPSGKRGPKDTTPQDKVEAEVKRVLGENANGIKMSSLMNVLQPAGITSISKVRLALDKVGKMEGERAKAVWKHKK